MRFGEEFIYYLWDICEDVDYYWGWRLFLFVFACFLWILWGFMICYNMVDYIKNQRHQKNKYKTIGKLISLITFMSQLFLLPTLLHPIWPYILQTSTYLIQSKTCILVIVGGLTNISALLINNIFYLIVYKIKHPFF